MYRPQGLTFVDGQVIFCFHSQMSMEATAKARHNQEIVVEKLRQTKEQLMAAEEALKETRKNEVKITECYV